MTHNYRNRRLDLFVQISLKGIQFQMLLWCDKVWFYFRDRNGKIMGSKNIAVKINTYIIKSVHKWQIDEGAKRGGELKIQIRRHVCKFPIVGVDKKTRKSDRGREYFLRGVFVGKRGSGWTVAYLRLVLTEKRVDS